MTDNEVAEVRAVLFNGQKKIEDAVEMFADRRIAETGIRPMYLIATEPDSHLAQRCLSALTHAEYGIALSNAVAVVYGSHAPGTIWHETLHLMGLFDCYCEKCLGPLPFCDSSRCIMRYDPASITEADWPFLCSRQISKLRVDP